MQTNLVMTVIGADRQGLVKSLADVVKEHGGSWLESRMARLAGQFAGVVRVVCPPEQADALMAALQDLSASGITVQAVRQDEVVPQERISMSVEVTGNDRPGIVSDLTRAIAMAGANVEELETNLESAPMSGHALFRASGVISLAAGSDTAALIEAIHQLSGDLTVDVT
jgi:glycine cleavage system regulatory protein